MTRAPCAYAGALALLFAACGGGGEADAGIDAGEAGVDAGPSMDAMIDAGPTDLGADLPDLGPIRTPTEWVITSDFLAHTLTIWNRDGFVAPFAGADRAVIASIDLSAYAPGPLEHAVTPDGRYAVVAVGPGFLDTTVGALVGATHVPPGGTLLIVDLVARSVLHEVATMDVPMSVALSPDGTRAYVACYGTSTARGRHLAVVSVPDGALLDEVDVGSGPEQVSIRADGLLGIVNLDGDFSARTFDPASVATSLSPRVVLGGDPDEAAFLDGTHYAVIAQSLGPSGVALLDLSTPGAPTSPTRVDVDGIPYGATPVPGMAEALLPVGGARDAARLTWVDVDATGIPTVAPGIGIPTLQFSVPTHAALDPAGPYVFLPMAGDGALAVVELGATPPTPKRIPWAGRVGPTWATVSAIPP